MVFWLGLEKRPTEIGKFWMAQNVGFDNRRKRHNITGIYYFIFTILGGVWLIENLAVRKNKNVFIYKVNPIKPLIDIKLVRRLPIVSSFDDLDRVSSRVSVATDSSDIELIRELFGRGHKVSWYAPDLKKHLNDLFLFNFEHLFLDVYDVSGYLNVRTMEMDKKPNDNFKKKFCLRRKDLKDRFNFFSKYNISRFLRDKYGFYIDHKHFYRHYYNYIALNYLLWKKSFATTATKKIATKE
ncbi:MAG TPA: hypothetical protein ENJ27_00770 [Candidatus Moranbacteria bacterium]|nr:hypothetical protein [Candidatus Moranbacteria bacterium]